MHENLLYTLFFSCFLVISSFSVEPILVENAAVSILINSLSKEKKASFLQQYVAQILIHDSEMSYLKRCITSLKLSAIRKQMIYYLGQYDGMLNIGSFIVWVEFACFAAIFVLFLFFM